MVVSEAKTCCGGRGVVVRLSGELSFESTMPYQPRTAGSIVFWRVDRDFGFQALRGFYNRVRRETGARGSIVFLTAVDVRDYHHEVLDEPETHVLATVGIEPPACPEGGQLHEPLAGTINIAVVTSASMARSGRADLMRVVAEAKAVAASDALLECKSRPSGTATDAIAVGSPSSVRGYLVAGFYTRLGGLVASTIHRVLVDAIQARMSLDKRLRSWLGVGVSGLLDAFERLYSMAPVEGVDSGEARSWARAELERLLRDPNVAAIMIAGRELDLHGAAGSIPGVPRGEYARDSPGIVADELLGSMLALYLAGFKGLLAAYWVERVKKEGLASLGLQVFADDLASALLGALLARMYDQAYR